MKFLKLGMRLWILVSTIASFLFGWAMLAHAPKPVQPGGVSSVPTLAPLAPLNFKHDEDFLENGPQIIQRSPSLPVFRTGGS